jgi:bisphosphoglycerate-independent phosphoglycerate mutase (AlkP superfamily)
VSRDPAPHNFKERTGQVLSVLRRHGGDYERVVDIFVQSLRLADKRNTIAHNPTQVQVWEHSKTGGVMFEHAITSTTSAEYIDDAELTELRAEAEDISTRLYMALGYTEPQKHAR